VKRREFITLLGGAVAWPLAARAQQPERVRRIGVLMGQAATDPVSQARNAAFLQGLQELGWMIGRNVEIEYRWAPGGVDNVDNSRRNAEDLVALAPDVILATGGSNMGPLLQATRTVPIVFVQVTDPVGAGYVESLARPGGNATGFIPFEFGISGKWLELLKEIAPGIRRVAVLRDAALAMGMGQLGAIQSVSPSFGVELRPVGVADANEIERGITAFARDSHGALILTNSPAALRHRKMIIGWRRDTSCPPSILIASSPPKAAWFPTDRTRSSLTDARPATSTASSRARSPPICQCSYLPGSNWRSIS
jgi:putative ABC transport system substrate-binding protein